MALKKPEYLDENCKVKIDNSKSISLVIVSKNTIGNNVLLRFDTIVKIYGGVTV